MEKKYFPLIVLIIASDDDPAYLEMKKISLQYYSLFKNDVKFFYLYCKPKNEIVENNEHDLYFSGCDESVYPGIYYKTAKAVQYIEDKFEYSYLIRTNLSTFWNIKNLFSLVNSLPRRKCLTGAYKETDGGVFFTREKFTYLEGFAIILSRDVVYNIFIRIDPLFQDMSYLKTYDDLFLAKKMAEYSYNLSKMENYNIMHLINNNYFDENVLNALPDNEFNNVLAFRIKNVTNRNIDIEYMKLLLHKIYGIKNE